MIILHGVLDLRLGSPWSLLDPRLGSPWSLPSAVGQSSQWAIHDGPQVLLDVSALYDLHPNVSRT